MMTKINEHETPFCVNKCVHYFDGENNYPARQAKLNSDWHKIMHVWHKYTVNDMNTKTKFCWKCKKRTSELGPSATA